jgi:methyl-accepting chemotaxis protein
VLSLEVRECIVGSIKRQLIVFGCAIMAVCTAGGVATSVVKQQADVAAEGQVAAANALFGHMSTVFLNEEARTIAHSSLIFNEFTADERSSFDDRIKVYGSSARAAVADYAKRSRAEVEKNLQRPLPHHMHQMMSDQLALLATYHGQLDAFFATPPVARAEVMRLLGSANETRSKLGGARRAIGDALLAERDARAAEVNRHAGTLTTLILAGFALVMAMVGVFALFAARTISRFGANVKRSIEDMEAGRNLDDKTDVSRIAEFAMVNTLLQDMQDKHRELAALKSRETEALNARAGRADSLEGEVAGFETQVQAIVTALKDSASQMRTATEELVSATGAAQDSAAALADLSNDADHAAQTVASATTEMSTASADLTTRLNETVRIVEHASTVATTTNESVAQLDGSAQKIGEVVALIRSIAEQTNLLALNATIEAARAGESGRGFAVVASEVKSLAARTATATEDIARQISAIQSSATMSAHSIREIAEAVSHAAMHTQEMSAMIVQQDGALQQVSETAEASKLQTIAMRSGAEQIASSSTEANQSAGMIGAVATDIERTSREIDEAVRAFLSRVAA